MPGATQTITFEAPIEKAFEVIADYEKYSQFLPEVKQIRVEKKGAESIVHYEVDVIKTVRYAVKMKEERPKRISWSFVSGEFMKDNRGHWELESIGKGRTKATYQIEMALGPLVPKTIINALVEKSLPKMLEAFKKRIEA